MHHSKNNNHYWHLCLLSLALAIVATSNPASAFSYNSIPCNIKRIVKSNNPTTSTTRLREPSTMPSSSNSLRYYRAIDHGQEEYCNSSCSISSTNDEMLWQEAALLPQSTTITIKQEEEIQQQVSISRDSGIITTTTSVCHNKPLFSTVELRQTVVLDGGGGGDPTTKSYGGSLIETVKAFFPVAIEITAMIGLTANHVH